MSIYPECSAWRHLFAYRGLPCEIWGGDSELPLRFRAAISLASFCSLAVCFAILTRQSRRLVNLMCENITGSSGASHCIRAWGSDAFQFGQHSQILWHNDRVRL